MRERINNIVVLVFLVLIANAGIAQLQNTPSERVAYFEIVENIQGMSDSEANSYLDSLGIPESERKDYKSYKPYDFYPGWIGVLWHSSALGTKYIVYERFYKDQDGDKYGNPDNYVYFWRTFLRYEHTTFNKEYEESISQSKEEITISDAYGTVYTETNKISSYNYEGSTWVKNNFGTDCNDNNSSVPSGLTMYFRDWDGDGYGSDQSGYPAVHLVGCPPTSISGYSGVNVSNNEDCNDFFAEVTTTPIRWYVDADGDGYGNPNEFITSCERRNDYVTNNDDCNDDNPLVNTTPVIWYADQDNDGFGDPNTTISSCYQPTGYVTDCYFDECPDEAGTRDNGCPLVAYNLSNDKNYQYERIYVEPYKVNDLDNVTASDVLSQVTYVDGSRRAIQQNSLGVSSSDKGVITHVEYDGNGEQTKSYLPYAAISSGQFDQNGKTNTLNFYNVPKYENTTNPYAEVRTEDSPLSKPLESAAPGNTWKMNHENDTDHTTKSEYKFNTGWEYVRNFTARTVNGKPQLVDNNVYSNNKLYKRSIKGENWKPNQQYTNDHVTEEFTDLEGKLILRRTFDKNKWHDTYYVYDESSNLVFVLPPKLNTYKRLEQQPWMGEAYEYTDVQSIFSGDYTQGEIEIFVSTHYNSLPYLQLEIYAYRGQPTSLKNGTVFNLEFDPPLPDMWLGEVMVGNFETGQEDVGAIAHIKNNALYFEAENFDVEYIEAELEVDLSRYQINTPTIEQEDLDVLAYQYVYDHKNRLVERKVPGKGWEYIVYNRSNQPVLTQDAKQRVNNEWIFIKYDEYGREVFTGVYRDGNTRQGMQEMAYEETSVLFETRTSTAQDIDGVTCYYTNSAFPFEQDTLEILTINYYDNYEVGDIVTFNPANGSSTWEGMTAVANVSGLSTVSQTRVLGTNQWVTTAVYYDNKGRAWETHVKNEYLNTEDWVLYKLDFTGKVLKSQNFHTKNGVSITTVDEYTYDQAGRLLTHTQKINNQSEELITKNEYDELGALINQKVGNTETNPLQNIDYTYTIRGWLKSINDPDNMGNDLFGMGLNYQNPQGPGTSVFYNNPLYNGVISHIFWKTNNESNDLRHYTYRYDALNRLDKAFYAENNTFIINIIYRIQNTIEMVILRS